MLFIFKDISVSKSKMPDISPFCSQLTFYCVCCGVDGSCRNTPAMSLYTWRRIPAEALKMCRTTEAKKNPRSSPNLNPENTQPHTRKHTHTHCFQSETTITTRSILLRNWGRITACYHPWATRETLSCSIHICTQTHKATQVHTTQAYAHSGHALQASLAFGWLWHNENTVKTSSRLSATLSNSVVSLTHRESEERSGRRMRHTVNRREKCLNACMPVFISMMVRRETMAADRQHLCCQTQ